MTDNDTIVLKANDWFVLTYLDDTEKGRVLDAIMDTLNGRQRSELSGIENVAYWAIINAQESRHG